MPNDGLFSQVMRVLEDPAFQRITDRAEEAPLAPTQLAAMAQPPGLTPSETWRLLTALRRPAAVHMPASIRDSRGRIGWYYLTRSTRAELAEIDHRCRPGSPLDRALRSADSATFVAESHVAGTLAAVREDGVAIPLARAEELMTHQRHPKTPEERVLVNCHELIRQADGLLEGACTPELLREIHARLSEGIPQETASLPPLVLETFVIPPMPPQAALDFICASVNSPLVTISDHPLVCALGLRFTFCATQPFPSWNGAMAHIVARLLFARSGLPALSYVPVFQLQRDWQFGTIRPGFAPVTGQDASICTGHDVDHTLWVAVMARLVRQELDATERSVLRASAMYRDRAARIAHETHLNRRQRLILAAAMAEPTRTFTIESHRRTFDVVRATARTDLLQLTELGYLRRERDSHTFVFTPTHKLLSLGSRQTT